MADEGDNNFVRYIYRGEDGERIPYLATHVTVHEDVTVVLRNAFFMHQNIIEIICHDKVKKIEKEAFWCCPRLRRVTMPGVKIVGRCAFMGCNALAEVECGKLERIEGQAFQNCKSLRSINLPSAEIVELEAFRDCKALTDVKFGNKLERIIRMAFRNCNSLERITIPLKDDMILDGNIFSGCAALNHVGLVEGAALHKIVAALQLEAWRIAMNREIDSINQILPRTRVGNGMYVDVEKARAIQEWIRSLCYKMDLLESKHQRILDEAADTLKVALPRDIVMKNVLPFLELPFNG